MSFNRLLIGFGLRLAEAFRQVVKVRQGFL